MRDVRQLPAPEDGLGRVDTGPVQFGDDWPGTFIRGDNGAFYAMELRMLKAAIECGDASIQWHMRILDSLADLFGGAIVGGGGVK